MNATDCQHPDLPDRLPDGGPVQVLRGPRGQPSGRPSVLVKITADNGTVGWGQSVPTPRWSYETLETVDSTIRRYLAPELIGRDPFDLEGIRAVMDHAIPLVLDRPADLQGRYRPGAP